MDLFLVCLVKKFTSELLMKIILFVLFKLAIKSWHILGDGLAIELLTTEKGNRTAIIANQHELQNASASDQSSVSNLLNPLLKARFRGGRAKRDKSAQLLWFHFSRGREDKNPSFVSEFENDKAYRISKTYFKNQNYVQLSF